jgi:hypothetical protein
MHSGCLHWQGVSEAFFVSAHVVLQCFFPGSVGQLQALFSHSEARLEVQAHLEFHELSRLSVPFWSLSQYAYESNRRFCPAPDVLLY